MTRQNAALIEHHLRSRGVSTASELGAVIHANQSTVSRALRRLGRDVVRLGAARSTRYALRRPVRQHGSTWPLYGIQPDGSAALLGQLTSLYPKAYRLETTAPWPSLVRDEFADGLFPDLPWFLEDVRPQGFLGRLFARRHAVSLGISPDLRAWTSDDMLAAILQFGHDQPGGLVLGEVMLQKALTLEPLTVPRTQKRTRYPQIAAQIEAGQPVGSSAAGEQSKFAVRLDSGLSVLVKYSLPQETEVANRWADLLTAEHVANSILQGGGIDCAQTRIHRFSQQTFLESVRFDRTEQGGRHQIISLASLDAAFLGEPSLPWVRTALLLEEQGWITASTTKQIQLIWWFGHFIGNTDMHQGNLSFYLSRSPPLSLAPVYDMAPMQYRPTPQGHVPNQSELRILPPPPEQEAIWREAAELARDFWQQIGNMRSISEPFRQIARANLQRVITASS